MKYLFGTVFIVLSLMIFRPIPSPTENNCVLVKGIVEDIKEGEGEHDIVLKMKDDPNYYYVNRGLERGLTINKLEDVLLQKTVQVYYVKHWTPLDPTNSSRHIAKIAQQGIIVYDEILK